MNLTLLNERGAGRLPGLLGIEIVSAAENTVSSRMKIHPQLLAPNGYLHAATVVALADTTCGYGAALNLPAGADSFATIELKTNFIGTARDGAIACTGNLVHGGKNTQVWDATVTDESSGKVIALFRCTQQIIYFEKKNG